MPILQVFSPVSPKDQSALIKALSSTFSEAIDKPESVRIECISSAVNSLYIDLFSHFHQS
jgi:hypothetical protein